MNIAILDDYQAVAGEMTDWSELPSAPTCAFPRSSLRRRFAGRKAARLRRGDGDAGAYSLPRSLLERLPNLRLLITSGRGNASFDLAAATELGITVCGTDGAGEGPTELTWD